MNTEIPKNEYLRAIIAQINREAPTVEGEEIYPSHYRGEKGFIVDYEDMAIDCIRRTAYIDTTNLDYYNGTGYSNEIVYDEIAILGAWNLYTGEDDDELVTDLNELLC